MQLGGVKDKSSIQSLIPEIDGDRCVHAHIEIASCSACVESCPKNAWILSDESLGLNVEACDGCGLCVPSCTEGAILQIQKCSIREDGTQRVLLLGCEKTNLEQSNCKCIHSISTTELLKLKRDGIHNIYVSTANCDACSRGENERLFERISQINRMLKQNNLPQVHYKEYSAQAWKELWKTPEKTVPGPEMSRRVFFRSAITKTAELVMSHSTFDNTEEFVPLGKILPLVVSSETIYPAVPVLNEETCNGCDACMRACPHDVIKFQHDGETQASYSIDASACTGCFICRDICEEEGAIDVLQWATQSKHIIPLSLRKCKSCGADYHLPTRSKQEESLCRICKKVDHQKNLFQILT